MIYLGAPTAYTNAIVAISQDLGDSWGNTTIPTEGAIADQPWLYLGPFPSGIDSLVPQYKLLAWFKNVGLAPAGMGTFSLNGGTVWAPLTALPKAYNDNLLCAPNAQPSGTQFADDRVARASFAGMRAGPFGGWDTESRFYWTMISPTDIYVCYTEDYATTWAGWKLTRPGDLVLSTPPLFAFDDLGTLYLMVGNKLFVSLDGGKNFPPALTWDVQHPPTDPWVDGDPIEEWFVVRGGYVHVIELIPKGAEECIADQCWARFWLKADTQGSAWGNEVVEASSSSSFDYVQIVLDGDGRPILGYTDGDHPRAAYRTTP